MSSLIEGTILFHKVIQDVQTAESTDGRLVSTLFFDYYIAERPYENLHCNITHTFGGPFDAETLEVGAISQDVPMNPDAFRMSAEKYYRKCMKRAISYRGSVNARTGTSIIQLQDIQKIYVQVEEPAVSLR